MKRLLRKGICVLISLALVAAFPAFSASAAETYTFRHTPRIGDRILPVGTLLRFQSAPLKKEEKLCYTAGNGSVLHTFVSGKPIRNVDGTVTYNLGFICCGMGETGLYIHINGKPFQIASVMVISDEAKTGFPLRTSFGQIFRGQTVEKIVITDDGTGKTRETEDTAKISGLMTSLSPERLYRDCDTRMRLGGIFTVEFHLKGQEGAYVYSPCFKFYKKDGFSAPLPAGKCVEESLEEVYGILAGFYAGLK